jgi:hypothetical protein
MIDSVIGFLFACMMLAKNRFANLEVDDARNWSNVGFKLLALVDLTWIAVN